MCVNEMLFLDLETTGLSADVHDIVEIGAWLFRDGVAVDKFSRRIKPSRYITLDVQNIIGLTNEDLADCETIDAVLPEFIDFCGQSDLYGYNIQFDYRFLCKKARNLGYDFTLGGMRRGVDVLKCVRSEYDFENYKLCTVAREMGLAVEADKLHMADYDSYIAKLVYDRCRKVKPELLDKQVYGHPVITDTLDLE